MAFAYNKWVLAEDRELGVVVGTDQSRGAPTPTKTGNLRICNTTLRALQPTGWAAKYAQLPLVCRQTNKNPMRMTRRRICYVAMMSPGVPCCPLVTLCRSLCPDSPRPPPAQYVNRTNCFTALSVGWLSYWSCSTFMVSSCFLVTWIPSLFSWTWRKGCRYSPFSNLSKN